LSVAIAVDVTDNSFAQENFLVIETLAISTNERDINLVLIFDSVLVVTSTIDASIFIFLVSVPDDDSVTDSNLKNVTTFARAVLTVAMTENSIDIFRVSEIDTDSTTESSL
jgi:hypothetical protein